jgi:N-succinyldiaminopimelate aminotransferase
MNPRLDLLQPYPFERLKALMADVVPTPGKTPISLSIGEPRHASPPLILETLAANLKGLSNYPATLGGEPLRQAISQWIGQRYNIPAPNPATEVLPTLGSREALFSMVQVLMDPDQGQDVALCPNPFYQIYEGATLLAGGKTWFVNADPSRDFALDYDRVPSEVLKKTRVVFTCSPGNPTGRVLSLEEWKTLFELSDRYGFTIVSDECYSEIYPDEAAPPLGALEAAHRLGRKGFPRLVVMNSLSKRSNVPGLRSAFVAGDAQILKRFVLYRTYHGSAMNPAVQAASEAAWQNEAHVVENRALYRRKMDAFYQAVHPVLPLEIPQAGFYYWAHTPINDVVFTRRLLAEHQVAVLPGSLLAREAHGFNPGQNRIRIALMGSLEETLDAANRIQQLVASL